MADENSVTKAATAPRANQALQSARRCGLRAACFALGFATGALLALLFLASEPGAPFRFIYEAF